MLLDEAIDGGLEIDDGAEDAVLQASASQLGEEALDAVQPGTRRRHEVESPARMPSEPSADLRLFVGGVVVEDNVDGVVGRQFGLQRVQKTDELLVPMPLHVAPDHRAVEHVQSREQRGRPVAFVVVRHGRAPAALERQPGLCAVERLDLALLIHR